MRPSWAHFLLGGIIMQKDNETKGCIAPIIFMILGFIIAILLKSPWLDDSWFTSFLIGGGVAAVIGFIGFMKYASKDEKEKQEAYQKEHPYDKEEKFYQFCIENGYSDIETKAGIEKLKLFAQSHTFTYENQQTSFYGDNAVKAFQIGKREVEKGKERERQKELDSLSEQEKQALSKQHRFAMLYGREKRIQMCLDIAAQYRAKEAEYRKQINSNYTRSDTLYNSMKQSEVSWGTAGGIASGIAGPAAGIAAAIDAQNRNTKIQQQNENLAKDLAGLTYTINSPLWEKCGKEAAQAEKYEKAAENAKTKLVEDLPVEELMERISPKVKKANYSETGAAVIEISFQRVEEPLLIYDNVQAVVDGSLKVKLVQNEVVLATEFLPLPEFGAVTNKNLKATIPLKEKVSGDYQVIVEPNRLWAIEK